MEHADAFVLAWSHFDPNATGWMPARCLVPLLRELPPPLGLDPLDYPQGYVRASDLTRYAHRMHLHPRLHVEAAAAAVADSGGGNGGSNGGGNGGGKSGTGLGDVTSGPGGGGAGGGGGGAGGAGGGGAGSGGAVYELSFSEVLACLAKDAFYDEDDDGEAASGNGDEYGLHGSPLTSVHQAWRHAQNRARRRELRMRGGHSWAAVLPAHAGGKALRVAERLAEQNIRLSRRPDEDSRRLARIIASAVIAHAWRTRSVQAAKHARNMRSLVKAASKAPQTAPAAAQAPAHPAPAVPGYLQLL